MKCNNCKTDYLNAYDTIRSEGIKYKVYICPCCNKNIFVPIRKYNIKQLLQSGGVCGIILLWDKWDGQFNWIKR